MDLDTRYINQVEVILNLFTFENGKIKLLLIKRTEEPFKNYWYLPSNLLMTSETIEECAKETILEYTNLNDIQIFECNTFSEIDRLPNDRILANSWIGIVPCSIVKNHQFPNDVETEWFTTSDIPKTVYDHNKIIETAINYLKKQIQNNQLVDLFLENDFTLPELQNIYEFAYDKTLDRRNFRKSMLATNKIVESNKKGVTNGGRPPKLYHFVETKIPF